MFTRRLQLGAATRPPRVTSSISFHHTLVDAYVFVGRYGTLLSFRFLFGSGSGDGSAMGSRQRVAVDVVLFREIRRQWRVQREWERGMKIIGISSPHHCSETPAPNITRMPSFTVLGTHLLAYRPFTWGCSSLWKQSLRARSQRALRKDRAASTVEPLLRAQQFQRLWKLRNEGTDSDVDRTRAKFLVASYIPRSTSTSPKLARFPRSLSRSFLPKRIQEQR